MSELGFVVVVAAIGLSVGCAAHLLAAREERRRGGWFISLALGLLGATAGGGLGGVWWMEGHGVPAGIVLFAFVGAVFLVALYHIATSGRPLLR